MLELLESQAKGETKLSRSRCILRLPQSRTHPRRPGREWPREAWDNVISYLTRLGAMWEDADIQISLGNLEHRVEEVFAMKMRPTGM